MNMTHQESEDKKLEMKDLPARERLKYEIAGELGLLEKVKEGGWKSLTAKETGQIGGLMTKRKKQLERQKNEEIKNR